MTAEHRCEPIVDADGNVLGHALVAPDMDERGRAALLLAEAVSRWQEQQDAADPEAAAERARRYAAGQERIRALNARLRGEG